MRYLRMLSNAAIAGGLASAYLTVLVLQINPSYPIDASTIVPLAVMCGAVYGANLTAVFYAVIVLRQLLAAEMLSPGWLSVRLLSWLCAGAAVGGAAILWLNLRAFGPVLDDDTVRRMAAGAVVVSAAAATFLAIALAHIRRRGGRVSAAVLTFTMLVSVAGPVALRGPARHAALLPLSPAEIPAPQTPARVTLLMLDGASLDVISPAIAQGQLPNFGRVFDAGAVLHLATLRPTQAEPVWSAVATGRMPMRNGVRSSASYHVLGMGPTLSLLPDYCFAQALVRFGFLAAQPHTAEDLAARPLWGILGDLGVSVGVIGWPLTNPAPAVDGFLVSDLFHQMSETQLDFDGAPTVWPSETLADARAALAVPADPDPVPLVSILGVPPAGDYDVASDPVPVLADRVHLQLWNGLSAASSVRFLALRFPGVDAVGHYFLRYANPSSFGDVSEQERREYGRVLDSYYGFIDTLVGKAMASLGADDLLLVVSGFGMEPLSQGKRLLERLVGNDRISGTHERSPDGFVLAYGGAVQPGRQERASVVDIAPTILYFFGLPVGRDMEGFARTDLFKGAFTAERPVTYIPSYGR